jgi:Cytochrome P460
MIPFETLLRPLVRSLDRVIPSFTVVAASTAAVALFATPLFGEPAPVSSTTPPSIEQPGSPARTRVPSAAGANDSAKYNLRVPGGLAFSEFRGYEDWAVISIDHTGELMKVILGNSKVMEAFRAGIPRNGKPFPDGSKMAKVEWHPKKSPDAPYDINVPGPIYDLDFMVKDAKRFPDSGGWGYGVFKYDAASGDYVPARQTHRPPQGNDAKCGAGCHTIVKAKDYVFTEYAKR